MKERRPIFYDAEKLRWRRTRRLMEISGALLTLLLVYFFITVAGGVELPSSLLPDSRPAYHAVKKKITKAVPQREGRHKRVANIGQIPAAYDPLRAAFYVSWDANSLASLKKHYKDIDLLMPEQLHAISPDGAMTIVDYQRNQQLVVKASPAEAIARLNQDQLHRWMRSVNPPLELPMMGLLNNYDGTVWRVKELTELLANPAARHRLINDVVTYAVLAKQEGIVVDFEEVPPSGQHNFQDFVGEIGPALHAVGLKLMVTLPARDDAYDYAFSAKKQTPSFSSTSTSTGSLLLPARLPLRTGSRRICARSAKWFPHRKLSWALPIMRTTGRKRRRRSLSRPHNSACRKPSCMPTNRKRKSNSMRRR